MGANVCVTRSSEHTLLMIFPGNCNVVCCYSWVRNFFHTALRKFFYSTYCYGPLKKHARISASEIRVLKMIQSNANKTWTSFLWILSPQTLDKVKPSEFSVVYYPWPGLSFLGTVFCPFIMPGFLYHCWHWHSKGKVLAFLSEISQYIFLSIKLIVTSFPNDWKVLMQLHVFIARSTFPLAVLAFLVLRRQPVNLSCLSN